MSDDLRQRLSDRYERSRESERSRERTDDSPLATLVNEAVRKLVTAIVVAGALIGLGAYASGDRVEAPEFQVATTPDGRIIRLNTETGRIILCEGNHCGLIVERGQDLDDTPPARVAPPQPEARPALPAPAQPQDNAAAAPPAQR